VTSNDCLLTVASALGSLVPVHQCLAQTTPQKYPSQTINVVAATSAGGGVDLMARVVAQKLNDAGARAVVVNKPGGSGLIGFEFAAKAPPDGYTLLLASGGFVTINSCTTRCHTTWTATSCRWCSSVTSL